MIFTRVDGLLRQRPAATCDFTQLDGVPASGDQWEMFSFHATAPAAAMCLPGGWVAISAMISRRCCNTFPAPS